MRRLNKLSLDKIKQWEGLRLEAYQDQAGVWTIGYGHTGEDVYQGLVITKAEADKLLKQDLQWAQTAVDQNVKVELTDNQYGALVSFVFNVGATAFKNSTLLRKLNAGNYEAVPQELARWNKITVNGKKVPNRGLSNRRAAEAGLWATGEFVASNFAAVEDDRTPVRKTGEAKGGAVAGVGIAGEVATEAANQLGYVAEISPYIRILFTVLTITGVALTMYALIKRSRE